MHVLDPDTLAGAIRAGFWEPLTDPLEIIDPTNIRLIIDEAFNNALEAVSVDVKGILDDIVEVINEQFRAIRAEIRLLLEQIKEAVTTVFESLKAVLDRVERLVFVELLERLGRVIDNLGLSFDKELDRVRNAVDDMLAAIPVGDSYRGKVEVRLY